MKTTLANSFRPPCLLVCILMSLSSHLLFCDLALAVEGEEAARRKADILNTYYRGWHGSLDSCPCTMREMEGHYYKTRFEKTEGYFPKQVADIFHPGGSHEFRSREASVRFFYPTQISPKRNLLPIIPGQQCVYDSLGNLITHGPAAGTPDAFSPNATYVLQGTALGRSILGLSQTTSHTYWDESTFDPNGLRFGKNGLTWTEYHKTWAPNNGNNCRKNPSGASISVEVHENPRGKSFDSASGKLWDLSSNKISQYASGVTSPDIKVCVDNKCLATCLDSYLCFHGNLPLRTGQRVYVSLYDVDLFVDDIIGSGFCEVGLECKVGAATVNLMP